MAGGREFDLKDEVYQLEEAAEFIRMSPGWLSASDIPRARLGRRIVFRRSQLLAYIAARETVTLGGEAA